MQIRALLKAAQEQGWLPDSASLLADAEYPIVCLPFGNVYEGPLDIPLHLAFPALNTGREMVLWFSEEERGPWLRATLIEGRGVTDSGGRPCRKRKLWVRRSQGDSMRRCAIGEVEPADFEGAFTSDRPLVWESHDTWPVKGMGTRSLHAPSGPGIGRRRSIYAGPSFDADDPVNLGDALRRDRDEWRRELGERRRRQALRGEREARAAREQATREQAAREQEQSWQRRLKGPLLGPNSEDRF